MASISSRNLVDAVLRVERLGLQKRGRLAEEVCAWQPNLFFSVLVLQRYGATLEQLEVVLNLLLVLHEAMKSSGRRWPVISEDVQERCLKRISGWVPAAPKPLASAGIRRGASPQGTRSRPDRCTARCWQAAHDGRSRTTNTPWLRSPSHSCSASAS
jgi:hypothetical protein